MSLKEVHFYSNKIKSLILLVIGCAFIFIFFNKNLGNAGLGTIIMFYLGFLLFSFGAVYSILLLFRTKPLLTITDQNIIIYKLLSKPTTINFEDILSFYISDTTFRGIKVGECICITMKSNLKFFDRTENIINTDILNVKTNTLLGELNSRRTIICKK
ncbi:STM3941 family protein [Chryseobacterium viscerum]|uniref:STM3941 family protein n=1 Tax=Chryseobacterium viscerum TaxID=1037377 RepID=UPI0037424276